jgi:hypothetical protein
MHCHETPSTLWKKYSKIDLLEAVVGPIVDGTDGARFVKIQLYEQILRTQSRTSEMKYIVLHKLYTPAGTCKYKHLYILVHIVPP